MNRNACEPARRRAAKEASLSTGRVASRSSVPLLLLASWSACPVTSTAAEVPELVTDRPDQTESSVVVPPGFYQLELGWTFTRDDTGGVRTEVHEVPSTLLRIGLSQAVELRIGWTGFVDAETRFADFGADDHGTGDAEVGIKIHLAAERSARPELALLVATSVPVGDDSFTSDRFDPSVRLAVSHTLSERVGLGYNVGMSLGSEIGGDGDRDTLSSVFYTAALGFALSDRWSAFAEVFGDFPASAPGDPAHAFDAGFTCLLRANLQLDLAGGFGLSDAADDRFVGLGVTLRFPR